jgi:NADP-dependent 3-hydroxy acid dehydrogenase YdfG
MRTYMASKLATAVYAQELARRAAGTTVKSLTANPGVAGHRRAAQQPSERLTGVHYQLSQRGAPENNRS